MRRPTVTGTFQKDLRRMRKRGKDLSKLKQVMATIGACRPLPENARDHKLKGPWQGRRECHVEPDWLLIDTFPNDEEVVFERTGRHSDLFGE